MSNNYRCYDNQNDTLLYKFNNVNNDNNYPNEYAMQADNLNAVAILQESATETSIIYPSPIIILEAPVNE